MSYIAIGMELNWNRGEKVKWFGNAREGKEWMQIRLVLEAVTCVWSTFMNMTICKITHISLISRKLVERTSWWIIFQFHYQCVGVVYYKINLVKDTFRSLRSWSYFVFGLTWVSLCYNGWMTVLRLRYRHLHLKRGNSHFKPFIRNWLFSFVHYLTHYCYIIRFLQIHGFNWFLSLFSPQREARGAKGEEGESGFPSLASRGKHKSRWDLGNGFWHSFPLLSFLLWHRCWLHRN